MMPGEAAKEYCETIPSDKHGLKDCRKCAPTVREQCIKHVSWGEEHRIQHMRDVDAAVIALDIDKIGDQL